MKILLTLVGAAVLATGAWAGTSLVGDSDPSRTVSLPSASTDDSATGRTTTGAATTGATATGATTTTTTNEAEDISGPCDEAEHANDPRCTGAAGARADDDGDRAEGGDDHGRRHGRGDDDNGGDENGDDDRSGSNSGRG
jgi:hypothetical protein